MRILILNQFYAPDISPTAHLAASLAEDRAARGDEVTVIASRGGYVVAQAEAVSATPSNLRVIRIWTPQAGKGTHLRRLIDYASYYLLTLFRVATMRKQDVIVAMTTPPFIGLAGVLHKAAHRQTRLVLWNMDCYPDVIESFGMIRKGGFVSRMMRQLNRVIFEHLYHVVALDAAMIQRLKSDFDSRSLTWTVIPNWERAVMFPPAKLLNNDRKSSIQNDAAPFTILHLGNVGYGHVCETVIDAAKELRNESVSFGFYGGGMRWNSLVDAVKQSGVKNVFLHGYVPKAETPDLMAGADCALILLRDDALGVGSPSKMHANLAMGLPIIYVGPEGSNVDEAIKRFGCGISLRHGQSTELAAFVREMIADSLQLQKLRKKARQAFDEAYCDTRTLPQFDALLKNQ